MWFSAPRCRFSAPGLREESVIQACNGDVGRPSGLLACGVSAIHAGLDNPDEKIIPVHRRTE